MEFDQLMSSCTLLPGLSKKLAASFKDLKLLSKPVLYHMGNDEKVDTIDRLSSGQTQRLYNAIGEYSATEIAKLFETDSGKELHHKLLEVMTGEKYGVLLKGLPADNETKALIIHGLKNLFGDGELHHPSAEGKPAKNPFRSRPEVVLRSPKSSAIFHTDRSPGINNLHGESFLFMASGQETPYEAPTLFRKTRHPEQGFAAHAFQPDEMIVCNNRTIQHSASVDVNPGDKKSRYLMRLTTDDTTLSLSAAHMQQARDSLNVPHKGEALKNWVLDENERLKKQVAALSR